VDVGVENKNEKIDWPVDEVIVRMKNFGEVLKRLI
jgi:hypothetical protein